MRLNITIPQIALLSSAHGYIPPEEWDEGIPALLLNYNFTGNRGNGNDSYFFSELSGINIGPWRLRNNGSWNYFRGNGYHSEQWNNIGTWVQRAIIPLKSELVMGDGNTGSDIFDGVGFRGVRLYSSDNMYPDSQQGFAPTVRGIARTAAQLTIRQNGFIIYQSYVSPALLKLQICTRHLQMAIWMSPSTSAMAISRIIQFRIQQCRFYNAKGVSNLT